MIKMKLSTVLLSSAALLVAGAAYAADLPAKKAAPAAAPTGCAAFGAGFIAIPGGDTCLKISGYVRYSASDTLSPSTSYGTAPYAQAGVYDLNVDARNNTEFGTVRSEMEIGNNAYYYTSVGGFTAGVTDSITDLGIGGNSNSFVGNTDTGISYAMPVGTGTVTFGETTAVTNFYGGGAAVASGRPDVYVGYAGPVGPMTVNAVAVSHESDSPTAAGNSTQQGYALVGNAAFKFDPATITFYGAYSSGASEYVAKSSTATTVIYDNYAGSLATGSNVGVSLSVAAGPGSVNAWTNSVSVTDGDSSGVDTWKVTDIGVNYKYTGIKGMYIRPEYYVTTVNNNGAGNVTTQTVSIRIQRDF